LVDVSSWLYGFKDIRVALVCFLMIMKGCQDKFAFCSAGNPFYDSVQGFMGCF